MSGEERSKQASSVGEGGVSRILVAEGSLMLCHQGSSLPGERGRTCMVSPSSHGRESWKGEGSCTT